MIRKLFRFAALVALASAIVWLTREHLLPTPRVSHEPAPHYRSTPPPPQAVPDDLTAIKGIGPAYARKLTDLGIKSFRGLSELAPDAVADDLGTSPGTVAGWVAQARSRIS
ncbi:MAG: hypothetical protein GY788_02950 [bacterium]|nr:hypothetical protein [bacterium]